MTKVVFGRINLKRMVVEKYTDVYKNKGEHYGRERFMISDTDKGRKRNKYWHYRPP